MVTESFEELNIKILKCSHCPKEFKYLSEKNRHEQSHSPQFECEVCCKKFSFASALRRHHKQHERTKSVECKKCNRNFRDDMLLRRHMKYAHEGTFTCSKCSTQFSSEQALCTHMKSHKPESERRFKCSFKGCGKSFNFSHHLKHHELTHTNSKQHYCSVCGKGFIQYHHLKTHLKTHDPAKWIYCDISGCKNKFSTEYAKKRHMATHKIKPDSGISSDSNSCDTSMSYKESVEETILCSTCGENIPQADYSKHSSKCDILKSSSNVLSSKIISNKIETKLEQSEFSTRRVFNDDIGDCTSALGGCLTSGTNANCVCVQMSKPLKENYDFTPLENFDDTISAANNFYMDFNDRLCEKAFETIDYHENVVLKKKDLIDESIGAKNGIVTYDHIKYNNECKGCSCANSCNIVESSNCNNNIFNDIVPNVECRADGVVKIKDMFDMDLSPKVESNDKNKPRMFIPFSTCRDAVGNCLVGGNDSCLCARMTMDDQQAMAQEIDDITPKPKTENNVVL